MIQSLIQSKWLCESKADALRKQGYVCVDPEMEEHMEVPENRPSQV